MTPEQQRRALYPAPKKSRTEISIEDAQFVDVYVAVVHPRALNHAALTGRPQPQKRRLVEQRQPRHRHPASAAARYPRTAVGANTATSPTAHTPACSSGHSTGPPAASPRIASIVGDIGCRRTASRNQDGNNPTGATPVLKKSSATHPAPSQVTMARPSARTAMAITAVATPTEIITGTRTNITAAVQPPANRKPNTTPNTVSTMAEAAVRMASASSRPVRALARWIGRTHNLDSRPDSRSAGRARPAPRVPKTAPTTAHIGTSP